MDASNLTSNIINQVQLIMDNLNEYNDQVAYNIFWPEFFCVSKNKRNLAMNEMHYSKILCEDRIFELRCILN